MRGHRRRPGTGRVSGSGGTNDAPFFHAELQTDIIASGLVTNYTAATANRQVPDHEGLLKYANAGEARFWGARRVENLVITQDMTDAAWATGGGATIEQPDTERKEYRLSGLTDQNDYILDVLISSDTTLVNREFVGALELKGEGDDVGKDVSFLIKRSGAGAYVDSVATITLTSEWVRYAVTGLTLGSDNDGLLVQLYGAASNCASSAMVRNVMVEEVTGQSVQTPSEFVDADTDYGVSSGAAVLGVRYFKYAHANTVSSNVVTEVRGNAATGMSGLFTEPACTNGITNIDLTTWSEQRGNITASNIVGPDGRPTAYELQELEVSGTGHRLYRSATGGENTTVCLSVFAKDAGVADTAMDLGLDNDGQRRFHAIFDLTDGSVVSEVSTAPGTCHGSGAIALGNGWYWCYVYGRTDTTTDDSAITPFVGVCQLDGTIVYDPTGDPLRTIYVTSPVLNDSGDTNLVTMFPSTHIGNSGTRNADTTLRYGDITGSTDGTAVSAEATHYCIANATDLQSGNNNFVNVNYGGSNGNVIYYNKNTRTVGVFCAGNSSFTSSNNEDFGDFNLVIRARSASAYPGTHYIAMLCNGTVFSDATPASTAAAFSVGELDLMRSHSVPAITNNAKVWSYNKGQAWTEETT